MTHDTPPQVHYYTVDEIAAELRLHKMTVYRLVSTGTLLAHKIGRSVRIPADEFARYKRQLDAEATARAAHPPVVDIPGQLTVSEGHD